LPFSTEIRSTSEKNNVHPVEAVHDMQIKIREIAGQIQSGNFTIQDESWQEMKADLELEQMRRALGLDALAASASQKDGHA